ncbi:MAG TPA: PLP-dependent aminotransferase family protein [Phycisphaeraceae bacterium]
MFERHRQAPLYMQIAEHIARQIDQGTYRVGDAIPSVRAGRKLFKVSPGTLLEAYRNLEDRGYIRARPQSGYYVRQRAGDMLEPPKPSGTARKPSPIQVNPAIQMLRRMAERDLLQLGAAVPDASFMPTRALNQRLTRAVRIHDRSIHTYGPPTGLPKLRQQLARMMAGYGCTLSGDDLIITNGCTESLNLCLRAVTRPGDTVAIESPTYYGHLITLKGLGLDALPIETSAVEGISVPALEKAAKRHRIAAVVVTPSFANPTGSCMPDSSRRELLSWAHRTGTPIIEDDIYGDLYFGDVRSTPLVAMDSSGLVLYCSSTSKTLSSGFRVGWCVAGKYSAQVELLKVAVNPTSTIAPQHALADFLDNGGVHKHLRRLRRQYREQVDRFCESVTRHFPEPIRLHRPAGGHLLWIELPKQVDTAEVFQHALAHKISIAPGAIFSPNGQFRHYMRLNCAVPWSARVDQAIRTIGQIVSELS